MTRGALALVAGLALSAPVCAADGIGAAKEVVDGLVQELLTEVKANKTLYQNNDEALFRLIRRRILPAVDTATLSRLVLGGHWKGLGDDQRRNFTAAMESLLIRSYGKSLTLLTEVDRIRFRAPQKAGGGKYVLVASDVTFEANEPPLSIHYMMHDRNGRWQVFDLVIDGLSLVKQFRQSFDREIREDGFDSLLKRLNTAS